MTSSQAGTTSWCVRYSCCRCLLYRVIKREIRVFVRSEKFIIKDLSDRELFVVEKKVDWIKLRIREFQDLNTYQPPSRDDKK
jgi:hypothetical protein